MLKQSSLTEVFSTQVPVNIHFNETMSARPIPEDLLEQELALPNCSLHIPPIMQNRISLQGRDDYAYGIMANSRKEIHPGVLGCGMKSCLVLKNQSPILYFVLPQQVMMDTISFASIEQMCPNINFSFNLSDDLNELGSLRSQISVNQDERGGQSEIEDSTNVSPAAPSAVRAD